MAKARLELAQAILDQVDADGRDAGGLDQGHQLVDLDQEVLDFPLLVTNTLREETPCSAG